MKVVSVFGPKCSLNAVAFVVKPAISPEILDELKKLRNDRGMQQYRFESIDGDLILHLQDTSNLIEFSSDFPERLRQILDLAEKAVLERKLETERREAKTAEIIENAARVFGVPVEKERAVRQLD